MVPSGNKFLRVLPLLSALLAAAAPGRASEPSGHAGGRAAGGSHGYWRFGGFGGVDWEGPEFSPFIGAELLEDKYSRQLELLGGSWFRIAQDVRARAGLGFAFGRVKEADEPSRAGILELGLERELYRGGFGAGYRLISGSIGGSSPAARTLLNERARGRGLGGASVEPESYSYHELSGYGWMAFAGNAAVNARLAYGMPSYADEVWTGTLGLTVPLENPVWTLSPSVSFEHESRSGFGVYGGMALSRSF